VDDSPYVRAQLVAVDGNMTEMCALTNPLYLE